MTKKPVPSRIRAVCPECGASITFHDDLEVDDEVICPECDVLLVVAGIKPLRFEVAEEIDYDADDDDDEWDDDDIDDAEWEDLGDEDDDRFDYARGRNP